MKYSFVKLQLLLIVLRSPCALVWAGSRKGDPPTRIYIEV